METMYPNGFRPAPAGTPARRAAINGLAVVGFIALIIIGITLAIYSARFVPKAVSGIASAAVYLSSHVIPADKDNGTPSLSAVTATTTLPIETATSTVPATTTPVVPAETKPEAPATNHTTGGTKTTTVITYPSTPRTPSLYGLPNLSIVLIDNGYLTNGNDTSSFKASHTVPAGQVEALKFDIVNTGTNASGNFDFKALLPTDSTYTFYSGAQDSLNPGDKVEYVISFDRARVGKDQQINLTVDADNHVAESNENDNTATSYITVQ